MNAFEELLSITDVEKREKGLAFTPSEIDQQPATWKKAARILRDQHDAIAAFLDEAGVVGGKESTLILTGAGTSEYVGNAIFPVLRSRLGREVVSLPTTHLTTHAACLLVPGHDYVIISFARSGNSPESVATFRQVRKLCPNARQIVITCNKTGALSKAAEEDSGSLRLLLPEETNDQSLVMTSSYSTMAFTGVGLSFMENLDELDGLAAKLGRGAQRVMNDYDNVIRDFSELDFSRACYLGANTLYGTMQECHLKLQEMTDGRIACRYESFLSLRHGPKVFVDDQCVVVASLSSDKVARKYELDMLRELRADKMGIATLLICDRATEELKGLSDHIVELYPDEDPVDDLYRVMTDVVVGQVMGTFKSLHLGLKPDNPNPAGTMNRVVKGVTIYDS